MKTNKPLPLESEIQKSVIEYLTLKKWKCLRLNTGSNFRTYKDKTYRIRGMEEGMPDLCAFKKAVHKGENIDFVALYFIEIKRPGMKATDLQRNKMNELQSYGAKCVVATSIEDLQKLGL